jgi:hypothetical protein
MAEFEGLVHRVEQQIGRIAVLHSVVLKFMLDGLLSEFVNIFLMMVGSVISQFEKILGEGISGVFKPKSAVHCRDDAVLCTSLSSEGHDLTVVLLNTLINDTSSLENILVSLNTHNEGSEFKISCWRALCPHGVEQPIDFLQISNSFLKALVHQISIVVRNACVYLVVSLSLLVRFRDDGDVKQDETSFVLTSMEFSNQLDVSQGIFSRFYDVVVVIVWVLWVGVIGEFPVVEGVCLSIVEEWLLVVEAISEQFHWDGQFFWQMVHACSVVTIFEVVDMAWFEKIRGTEHGEVSEERSVETSIVWVHLLDLGSVVFKVSVDSLSQQIFCQKTFGTIWLFK